MKIIGVIFSEEKIKITEKRFKVVNNFDSIDFSLPVLIMGLKTIKKYYSNEFDILDKQLKDDIFWSFHKTEMRNVYQDRLYWFYEYSLRKSVNNFEYKYLNYFLLNKDEINHYHEILSKPDITFLNKNRFLYILIDDIVYGVDLNVLSLLKGYDISNDVINYYKNNSGFFMEDFDNYNKELTILQHKYYVPILKKLDNEEE